MSATKRHRRSSAARGIAPIYKRLPKGPHGIAPEDVAHHQRIRMHGAMIEAVATHGYERTSVKHVIGLAGVSRRAFYEQFANKDDCFRETFDLIVGRAIKRINGACLARKGSLDNRLRAALKAFIDELETNPKALHLVMIDALTAGPDAQQQLRKATAAFERLLANGFASAPGARTLPAPLVRAIIGGLRRVIFVRLRDERTEGLAKLGYELRRWIGLLTSPAVEELRMRACSQAPFPPAAQLPPYSGGEPSDRARLIHSVVDLALREPFEELSAPHIANEADLSIDTFLDLFESPQECFMAALDMLGAELLEVVADPALITPQWPQAVCEAIDRLSAHIAGNPAATTMLACKTFAAGLPVIEDMVSLTDEVATLLTEGAPRRARGTLAVEGVSGAFAHTLYTEAAAGRAHLLPSQVEYLSYIVLAPYMGAENAVQTIVASRPQPPPRPPSPALTQDAPTASTTTSAPAPRLALASLAQAALGKVREHDADKQRNHDHDDQWSLA